MSLRRIVVPLDGSVLAETAIPLAMRIAAKAASELTLVHVLERQPPTSVHGERHLADRAGASAYLESIVDSVRTRGIAVHAHVHDDPVRDVAGSLSDHVTEFQAELVVMTTHGRGGLARWVYGSIAQRIVATNTCPLLFVPGGVGSATAFQDVRHVIAPLDGDRRHETALPLASELAKVLDATTELVSVVPDAIDVAGARAAAARALPRTVAAELEFEAEAARRYLVSARDELPAGKSNIVVLRGEPAAEICAHARRLCPALIVMATHRKFGVRAFWSRSVAPRVAARARCPVALVALSAP